MREKILCPYHEEDTPSMVLYDKTAHCFGCKKTVPIRLISDKVPRSRQLVSGNYKEDIAKSLRRIAMLPTKPIRGFEMPYDQQGYYLLYPDGVYYTKRLWEPKSKSDKYRSPMGHTKPLYHARMGTDTSTLFVVEGQLNAKSLAEVTQYSVVSPGGATDLNRTKCVRYCLSYHSVCIIVDKDAAGVVAALELRDTLVKAGRRVAIHTVTEDYSEIYGKHGKERLKAEEEKALQMLGMRSEGVLSAPSEGTKPGHGSVSGVDGA